VGSIMGLYIEGKQFIQGLGKCSVRLESVCYGGKEKIE
jgi:hypothetical protein